MLESIPRLQFFSRMYWNQMGDVVYGTIDAAFADYLRDGSRLPDGGKAFRRSLSAELLLILGNPDYDEWVRTSRNNRENIKALGGRFIWPDELPLLMTVLNRADEADS